MNDRPILFTAPMVRALLAGTKTQTRRLLKMPKWAMPGAQLEFDDDGPFALAAATGCLAKVPVRFATGDRLWVKETFALTDGGPVRYYATDDVHELRRKRVSIHMPRWASRLTLCVTDVRVQELRAISEVDVIAEGCPAEAEPFAWYSELWDSINGKTAPWSSNPWVVAVSFSVERLNIDARRAA